MNSNTKQDVLIIVLLLRYQSEKGGIPYYINGGINAPNMVQSHTSL